jgi:hypothetical protein
LDGFVDAGTVAAQLLYETTDPAAFVTPDAVVDFSDVEVHQDDGAVVVRGVRGRPAPPTLRALSYFDRGHIVELEVSYGWPDAEEKATRALDTIRARCERVLGSAMPELELSIVGASSVFGAAPPGLATSEVEARARVAFRSADDAVIDAILDEVGSLYDCGPPGACAIAGPTVGNPTSVRPWVEIVEHAVTEPVVHVRAAEVA